MALVSDQGFQHILRVLNTNVDGRQKARRSCACARAPRCASARRARRAHAPAPPAPTALVAPRAARKPREAAAAALGAPERQKP